MKSQPFLIILCLFVFSKSRAQSFLANQHFSLFQFYEKKDTISYNYSFALDDLLKIKSPLLLTYGMADVGSLHNDLVPY